MAHRGHEQLTFGLHRDSHNFSFLPIQPYSELCEKDEATGSKSRLLAFKMRF
jgi:hypothetical protein